MSSFKDKIAMFSKGSASNQQNVGDTGHNNRYPPKGSSTFVDDQKSCQEGPLSIKERMALLNKGVASPGQNKPVVHVVPEVKDNDSIVPESNNSKEAALSIKERMALLNKGVASPGQDNSKQSNLIFSRPEKPDFKEEDLSKEDRSESNKKESPGSSRRPISSRISSLQMGINIGGIGATHNISKCPPHLSEYPRTTEESNDDNVAVERELKHMSLDRPVCHRRPPSSRLPKDFSWASSIEEDK